MLLRLIHLFLRSPQAPSLIDPNTDRPSTDQVVLYAQIGRPKRKPAIRSRPPKKSPPRQPLPQHASHRLSLFTLDQSQEYGNQVLPLAFAETVAEGFQIVAELLG